MRPNHGLPFPALEVGQVMPGVDGVGVVVESKHDDYKIGSGSPSSYIYYKTSSHSSMSKILQNVSMRVVSILIVSHTCKVLP